MSKSDLEGENRFYGVCKPTSFFNHVTMNLFTISEIQKVLLIILFQDFSSLEILKLSN